MIDPSGIAKMAFIASIMITGYSCASSGKKSSAPEPVAEKGSDADKGGAGKSSDDDDDLDVSGKYSPFFNSLSGKSLNSRTVPKAEAEKLAREIEGAVKADPRDRDNFLALMAARRLAGQGVPAVLRAGSNLADIEMKRNIDRSIPSVAKLEIALTALATNRFAMAEHFLNDLLESKNKGINAAALNLQGLMEFADGRVPEAVNSWLRARKTVNNYQPATMNLALVAIKYGAHEFAGSMLDDLEEDWLVLAAKASVARLGGKEKAAESICDKALSRQRNKLTLLNCAIAAADAGDMGKAKRLLSDASSGRGSAPGLDKAISEFRSELGKMRPRGGAGDGDKKSDKK